AGSTNPLVSASPVPGALRFHFFEIEDATAITPEATSHDYAIINFPDYTFNSWFGVQTQYTGGTVHITGYPTSAGFTQTDNVGTVSLDPQFADLDYGSASVSPGSSGGPIWVYQGNGDAYVVGVVSTFAAGVQLTDADLQQIRDWQ